MLKVIHFSPVWLEMTQTWCYSQIKHLPESIQNHVVCRSTRNLDQFRHEPIHCLKSENYPLYLFSKLMWSLGVKDYNAYMKQKVKEIRPDVIHSHFGNNGWMNLKIAKESGIPHVVSFYGQDLSMLPKKNPIWLKRYRDLFEADNALFLCEGGHMRRCLIDMGCPPDKVKLHRLGVAVDQIAFKPRQWRKGETLKVLIAGSFREKKGIPYALKALAELKDSLPLQITIIGDAGDMAEKQAILQVIEQGGLKEMTRMLGYQPHSVMFEEAYRHHLFLSPSVTAESGDTEGGCPVSIIDMAASGMPIVSSFHCDIPELILQGETGWLAEERDVSGIVSAIRLWTSNSEWSVMLSKGRSHIEQNYEINQQSDNLAKHYREILGR